MKEKTSITLSSDLLADVDRSAGAARSRSAFIEEVLREYFKEKIRRAIHERDVQILNANADYFNREMEDVLRYQAPIDFRDRMRLYAPRRALPRASAAGRYKGISDICHCKSPIRNRFAIFNCNLRTGLHEWARCFDSSRHWDRRRHETWLLDMV